MRSISVIFTKFPSGAEKKRMHWTEKSVNTYCAIALSFHLVQDKNAHWSLIKCQCFHMVEASWKLMLWKI